MLDPKGPIALAERDLLFSATTLMLIIVVPVFVMTFWIVLRYRASVQNPNYRPDWDGSSSIEAAIWLIPAALVIAIGTMVWQSAHKLDPYRALSSDQPTLDVQVIALDWKWLFIYPDHNIATINELVFPVNAPLRLTMTSDTVMNSLAIPALAGQIYVMAGMKTELNLMASEVGTYAGRNIQYSGDGFPGQTFDAIALSEGEFNQWVATARLSPTALDTETYASIARPSKSNAVERYRSVAPQLFESVIMKYMHGNPAANNEAVE
jgi:cytochrome o ubiquinol oxidase subunit 2